MSQEAKDHDILKFLAAFADGELDIEQSIEVLTRLSMDRATAARVQHQQQLREAVKRVMVGPECVNNPTRCPDMVKAKIREMVMQADLDSPGGLSLSDTPVQAEESSKANVKEDDESFNGDARTIGVIGRIGRWLPLAAAAVLLAASIYISIGPGATVVPYNGSILSASDVDRFTSRHVTCSSDLGQLYQEVKFPKEVEALPGAVADYIGASGDSTVPMDLSVIGYQYAAAGKCAMPGSNAVHIVYQPVTEADSPADNAANLSHSLSLWVSRDGGDLELPEGKLHVASSSESGKPMMIWKRHGLSYYLVGPSLNEMETAANFMASR